jgi:hypothetical protein
MIPIAVNLVNETKDILETEIWITEREPDGTFVVTKKYEWVHSLENVTQQAYEANPSAYFRAKTVTDKYFINSFCRFERIVTEEVPDYSVVIFYYKDDKPEGLDENVALLQTFCEDNSIFFKEVHSNFEQTDILDYELNFITALDITPFMDLPIGVIFKKKGENPKTVPFGNYERMKIELKRYFKIIEG